MKRQLENVNDLDLIIKDIKNNLKQNNKPKQFSLDTETTGLDFTIDKIFFIPFAIHYDNNEISAYNISFLKDSPSNPIRKKTIELFNKLLNKRIKTIFHNFNFDAGMLKYDLNLNNLDYRYVEDTMLLANELNVAFFAAKQKDNDNNDYQNFDNNDNYEFSKHKLPLALKNLANKLGLKGVLLNEFQALLDTIKKRDIFNFKNQLLKLLKDNNLNLNKLEKDYFKLIIDSNNIHSFENEKDEVEYQTKLKKAWAFFENLIINPDDNIKNLKKLYHYRILKEFDEYLLKNNFDKNDNIRGLKEHWDYFELTKQISTPTLTLPNELLNLFKAFNYEKFNINPKLEHAKFFSIYSSKQIDSINISYKELNKVSPLTLYIYSIADAKLTTQVYDELIKIRDYQTKLNSKNQREQQYLIDGIEYNYRLNIESIYGVVQMKYYGMNLDIDYLNYSQREVKEEINFLEQTFNQKIKILYDYVIENDPNVDIEELNKAFSMNYEDGNFGDLKATEHQKFANIFKKYFKWFELFIVSDTKDKKKINEIKKLINLINLPYQDKELFNRFLQDNFKGHDQYHYSLFNDIFGNERPLYQELKNFLVNIHTNSLNELYYKILKVDKETKKFILKELKIKKDGKYNLKAYLIDYIDNNPLLKTFFSKFLKNNYGTQYVNFIHNYNDIGSIIENDANNGFKLFKQLSEKLLPIYIDKVLSGELPFNDFDSSSKHIYNNKNNSVLNNTFKKYLQEINLLYYLPIRTINQKNIEDYLLIDENLFEGSKKFIVKTIKDIIEIKADSVSKYKWYATYIIRFLKGTFFTSFGFKPNFSYTNAITGRLSGSSQQMPKDVLRAWANKDYILFNPRAAFIPRKNKMQIHNDYTNVEVIIVCDYLLREGLEDVALLEAYIPWNRYNDKGEKFDLKKHKKNFKHQDWYDVNTQLKWVPTDLHGALVKIAFPNLDERSEEFTKYRNVAKRIRFGFNYGQGLKGAISANKTINAEIIKKIYNGLEQQHPQLVSYSKSVRQKIASNGYITSFLGKRYAFHKDPESNKVQKSYLGINYLSQGSAAVPLKRGIIGTYNFIKENDKDISLINMVHDEIQFEAIKSVESIQDAVTLRNLMTTNDDFIMPIMSDMEIIDTNASYKWDLKEQKDGSLIISKSLSISDDKFIIVTKTPSQWASLNDNTVDLNNYQNTIGIVEEYQYLDDSGKATLVKTYNNH